MAGQFELDVARFAAKARGRMELVVRKVLLDITRRVILMSPVDTGRFRGNWQAAINVMPTGYDLEKFDKGGSETIDAAMLVYNGIQIGHSIWLVNNLPYARRLEYGSWSQQAPQGMVGVTLANYPGIVKTAVDEAKSEIR